MLRPPLALLALALILAACASQPGREEIASRTYVVTGASSGFGRGVATRVGAQGANVVLAARRAAVLEEVAGEIRAAGGQALVVPTDVSRPDQIEALAAAATARFGRIDVWVNNAAVAVIGRFEEIPIEDHARVVDVNLKGVIYGSHAALRRFRAQGGGTLVNIASVEGRVPLAYHASYSATKHAVIGLGNALNQELRLGGLGGRIAVSTVLPWAVDTPFWQHAGNYSGRTPRMVLMDGPDEVVNAIIRVSVRPTSELAVGWKAKGAVLGERIWPGLAERIAGDVVHRAQMERGAPAASTTGSLYAPVAEGTGVAGNARARMEREDQPNSSQ